MRVLLLTAAAGATLVLAAPAGAATFFESPSHNIGCVIGGKIGARCDIREHTWTPPPKPASCPVDWGFGLTVDRSGVSRWVCAGDSVFGGKRVLGYRRSIVKGRFRCTSYRNGVRCANTRNGHGFKIARRAARWY